jgi:diguanylate cyclase (GGDEF)-like protein/PAS domain S-box-containing protein
MRLRNWLAVVVSVLLLVAVGIVGVMVNRSALRAADTVHRSDSLALAVNNATLAGQMQQLSARELKTFADSHPFNLGAGYAGDRAALDAFAAKSASFPYGASITALDGTVLNASRINPLPLSTDPGYGPMRRLLLGGKLGVSAVMQVKDAGGMLVAVGAFAVPIKVNGVTAALLTGYHKFAATTLQAYIVRLKSGSHLSSIVDTAGRIGFTSNGSRIGTVIDPAVVAAAAKLTGGSAFVEYRSGGTSMISIVVKNEALPGGWAYVRTQTLASFDGAVHTRSQTINVTLLAMLLIGAVGISILGYRTQVQRRRADERFQALFLHAPDMVAVLDAAGRVAYSSPSAASVLHFPAGSLRGSSVFELVHPEDRPRMVQAFGALLHQRDGVMRMETRILNSSGKATWFEFTASNQMQNPALTGIVINARDISENRAFQERLHHEATHDALTGLPNRRRMQDALDNSLSVDAVAVLFVDLDGFKPVNDAHGHEAGDELLRQVAARLSACVREGDVLARVGGDEFVVLMPGVTAQADADTMSHRVRRAVELPFEVLGTEILIGASVGVHLATTDDDPDQALRAADHAMYAVKHLGGGRRANATGVPEPSEPAHAGRHRAD